MTTTPEEKYELITRRLDEVLGGETIKAILQEGQRPVKCYWGKQASAPFMTVCIDTVCRNCDNRQTYVVDLDID